MFHLLTKIVHCYISLKNERFFVLISCDAYSKRATNNNPHLSKRRGLLLLWLLVSILFRCIEAGASLLGVEVVVTYDQGAGIRGTWVEGVEVRTSSSPSPTPQKCIAKHREAELFPKAGNFCW